MCGGSSAANTFRQRPRAVPFAARDPVPRYHSTLRSRGPDCWREHHMSFALYEAVSGGIPAVLGMLNRENGRDSDGSAGYEEKF
jgi:hypothetical protein